MCHKCVKDIRVAAILSSHINAVAAYKCNYISGFNLAIKTQLAEYTRKIAESTVDIKYAF